MELDPTLQAAHDALCRHRHRRARAVCGFWAGVRSPPQLAAMSLREPSLGTPEPVLATREAQAQRSEQRAPLQRFEVALAEAFIEVAQAPAAQRLLGVLGAARASVELDVMRLGDALCELPGCPDRVRRAQLSRAVSGALAEAESAGIERLERGLEARHALGLDEAGWGALHGLERAPLLATAESVLRQSRDAAEELLAFRLRQARVGVERGAPRQDLRFALELPDLREHLSPHRASSLAEQVLRQLELDPFARGSVAVDVEPRPGRFPGLWMERFSPDALAVGVTPHHMPADLERLTRGLGQAQHAHHAPEWIGSDPALTRATGWLLARVFALPSWHRRSLRVPARVSVSLAQGFALRRLMALRRAAAQVLSACEIERQGHTPAAVELHRARSSEAGFADVGAQGAWRVSLTDAAASMRALLLAERLAAALQEGFDEDWWRNPSSASMLREIWVADGVEAWDACIGAAPAPAPDAQLEAIIELAAG